MAFEDPKFSKISLLFSFLEHCCFLSKCKATKVLVCSLVLVELQILEFWVGSNREINSQLQLFALSICAVGRHQLKSNRILLLLWENLLRAGDRGVESGQWSLMKVIFM